ncbi:MAG TPA: G8 domain-containing protein, partial [Candidatus Dormibacteraeota bacterium]|nr:G8 domain-containing protein [Candidatus Dormibacteraeota bacterium]
MTHLKPQLTRLILATAMLSVIGCGDSGSSKPTTQPTPVPLTCDGAFSTDVGASVSSAALRAAADEPAPVNLSTCLDKLGADRNVVIGGANGCGPDVVVDRDFIAKDKTQLGKITIESGGKLVFPDLNDPDRPTPVTLAMETTGILVKSGGLFRVGTAVCPVGFHPDAHVTITFTGARDPRCKPSEGCDDGSVKGIEVQAGGILDMHGAKGVPEPDPAAGKPSVSWTVLSASVVPQPTPAAAELHLAADVTQGQRPWEKGDWIVVGTSSFSPVESEFVEIAEAPKPDGVGGSIVKTMQPLRYAHFGSDAPTPSQQCTVKGAVQAVACGSVDGCTSACTSAPSKMNYNDPETKNFGIDERAEVGLISRSIKLTASTPPPPPPDESPLQRDPSLHWGGEIRIRGSEADPLTVAIVGVELEKFGKDQLGSYPIHIHMVGDAKQAPTINANSIHHSFNKCITVHMSSNLTFKDNVCARIVGHMFYEEHGSEERVRFERNLGLGAMSNSFDIYKVTTDPPNQQQLPRSKLISDYWWAGDNLANARGYNYDGFNIPNTDDQQNPTRGSCQLANDLGELYRPQAPFTAVHPDACKPFEFYVEPASGFWVTNPTTELIGNAVGGCQGVGRGVWWVPPTAPIQVNGTSEDVKFKPLGTFFDNRAHACYAGFYGEGEYGLLSEQLFPHKDGTNTGQPVIAHLDGMTATRNRFRGVWLRPTWFVVQDGRFATSRENVSLVTSGGIDGNAPGVWAMLQDSVLAGVSKNNFDRFGPCPNDRQLGNHTGGNLGCVDNVPPSVKLCAPGSDSDKVGKPCNAVADCCQKPEDCPSVCTPASAEEVGLGYPPPSWNMFGYMLYDGPVRVFDDRFVNFRKDVSSLLTAADNDFLEAYGKRNKILTAQLCVDGQKKDKPCNLDVDCPGSTCRKAPFVYEGDAALGWFQSNQSSYPTGTVTRGLSWVNTDLRHQIYTERVSVNLEFNDGDKNTAVIDEDGTLTGYGVGDPKQQYANPGHINPISLNNLPFNATSNSVDECFSRGKQNDDVEGRDTSLISPGSMGTLEFSTLYPFKDMTDDKPPTPIPFPGPAGSHTQLITFTRDDVSPGADTTSFHPAMKLHSRNGLGVWEPKVTSGFGYTAGAEPAPPAEFPISTGRAGIANLIDVGIADVVKPDISASNPFFIRLGICYTNADGTTHPSDPGKFRITRGYKSYTGGNVDPNDSELLKYWSPSACNNLDSATPENITGPTCPGPRERRIPLPESGTCPSGSTPGSDGTSCVFATDILDRVEETSKMFNEDGTPNLETFTYDRNTGMLFLWVAQDEPNPVAPSPLGSCTGNKATDDPACPDIAAKETYYACPVKGCHVYLINLDDPSYTPGTSNCQPYETYTHGPFRAENGLVLHGTKTPVVPELNFDKQKNPFHIASKETDPGCKETESAPTPSPSPAPTAQARLDRQANGSGAPIAGSEAGSGTAPSDGT